MAKEHCIYYNYEDILRRHPIHTHRMSLFLFFCDGCMKNVVRGGIGYVTSKAEQSVHSKFEYVEYNFRNDTYWPTIVFTILIDYYLR